MLTSVVNDTGQYLTFALGNELFALEINKVREVIDVNKITKVPQMPEWMLGVINLRGNVVTVIDMSLKFGISKEQTVNNCIIIVEIAIDNEVMYLGALVDSVQEVITIEPDQIEPPPKFGIQMNNEFITGLGKRKGEFVIILDSDKVFSTDELISMQNIIE